MDAGKAFEAQVRRVARAKWNLRPGEGESQYIGLQEFEIIAPTEDAIHLVMCTISESIKKIKEDTKKLTTARANLEVNELRPVTCWIITRNAPTADQISYGRQHRVRVEHFEEFQRTLINATEYFARRKEYRFGSARDPFQNDSDRIPDDEYIEPTFREHGRGNTFSLDKIGKLIEDGRVVVLLADFGYGKSLTVRELFFWLRNRYTNHQLPGKTPVAIPINLPEHGRQASHYTEILRQHARTIGYPDENHLVRVWNGGMAAVLLDGFDELPAVQLRDESPKSRADARREATKLIWDFVDSSRSRGGVLLSGRGQYFDSIDEMKKCCALKDDDLILEIEPFSDKQLHAFLQRKNISWSPPDWLPRNPLLISYLMARGLVEPVNDSSIIANPVEGWPYLLDKIYDRESNRTQRMFDGKQIGDLLQRLASRSRVRSGGGTLNPHDIYETYRDVFDESPIGNEYAVALLQRLPALTYAAKTKENLTTLEGHRTFVDSIMADALRGLDLVRFMTNPYDPFLPDRDSGIKDRTSRLGMPLSRFGCEIAAAASVRNKLMPSQLVAASERANSYHKDPLLATDISNRSHSDE
ncbi:MAG: hypothetical protein KF873_06365 [Gemmataceae bacterium]|nr:hypothetical protein [Gemmataceae bacterium]